MRCRGITPTQAEDSEASLGQVFPPFGRRTPTVAADTRIQRHEQRAASRRTDPGLPGRNRNGIRWERPRPQQQGKRFHDRRQEREKRRFGRPDGRRWEAREQERPHEWPHGRNSLGSKPQAKMTVPKATRPRILCPIGVAPMSSAWSGGSGACCGGSALRAVRKTCPKRWRPTVTVPSTETPTNRNAHNRRLSTLSGRHVGRTPP